MALLLRTGFPEGLRVNFILAQVRVSVSAAERIQIGSNPSREELVAECQHRCAHKHPQNSATRHTSQCAEEYHRHWNINAAA